LCTISSRSAATSTPYSTPCRRGATTVNAPSGAAESSSHHSLVSLLPTEIKTHFSSRDRSIDSQNRSSVSSYTITSDDACVPTRCRQTRYGRHASSTVT
jgi:hypothetical protein